MAAGFVEDGGVGSGCRAWVGSGAGVGATPDFGAGAGGGGRASG